MKDIVITAEKMYAGENEAEILNITVKPELLSGRQARIAFVTPSGKEYLSPALTFTSGACAYSVPFTVLDRYGRLYVQLIITDGNGYCAKSEIFVFDVEPSIDENCAELENGDFITLSDVEARLREVERILEELSPVIEGFLPISNSELEAILV